MKNLKEIKTTIIGSILFLVGIVYFVLNINWLNEFHYRELYIPGGFVISGILFLLAPDKALDIILNSIGNVFKRIFNIKP